ncbi:Alkaline phosphatase synthesis sensor protein PhoR [[Clostridium] sordellii]|uniref:histidine kinase n=1 Tax=Paraclostridium sordellii TaxID=1505 RepID=A0A9P1L5P7_PARSO|nr:sensor histidine kinase [Paeniclostridium sordellii]MDU2688561.1 histidine kinase dimerization/phospho-acceptor domain-containing protein [Paeniclostridium sordellii]MDU6483248.1 histidine kinase dimerization/phospho-acceptor domain-containing protein [Paeniclostridium sordellii]CEN82283.1 Alkaline phosphatase synthesis sensor protein PhoR [[Clostridium] sordellii] [Paeniclostridium sordellii]CEN90880.1 Alkaline phosphatase synthesis sensor protein PhoR [[Clostridium] sordellii] [Paeniclostr
MLDIKLKSNKFNIKLVIIITILIASIGMVLSYPRIKSDSKKFGYNIYEENTDFSNDIMESTYSLYCKVYDEKEEKYVKPADIMLEEKTNIDPYYKTTGKDVFNRDIERFNENLVSGLKNIQYCVLDKDNNVLKQNVNSNLDLLVLKNNEDTAKKLQEKYDLYTVLNFDDKGNMKVENLYGADRQTFQSNLNKNIRDDLFSYETTNAFEIKPIKNMKFIYGVPKNLKYSDSIADYKLSEQSRSYSNASLLFKNIGIIFVVIMALIIPYKEIKDWAILKKVLKLPIEIIIVISYLAYIYLYYGSDQIILKTANNSPIIRVAQLQLTNDISNILNYFINIFYWFVLFSIVFISIIVIKHIIDYNIVNYLKEKSLIYKILKKIKYKLDWIKEIKLGEQNKKKIVTILILNLVVVCIMCSTWVVGIIISPIYTFIIYLLIKKKYSKINNNYNILLDMTKEIANGNLDVKIDKDLGVFDVLKKEIENIQAGLKKAVNEEVKSQKMKTELISNVSHDLKTPLTSIITYVDLLKDENLSEEDRRTYLETLDRKSERLRILIEDLFEVSKANSGNVSLNIIDVDIVSLMKQTLLEVDDKFKESDLKIRTNFPSEKVMMKLDSQRMFRVFENLLMNISKYAMPSSRVYIDIVNESEFVKISFKNMTEEEIKFNVEDLVERFVRGDKSRNTEGSGLGLAIAKSFVELQGGRFKISVDGDLFKVTIIFKK